MPPTPSLVLVTGANGFLGSHLVNALVERGHRVRCLTRSTSNLKWLAPHKVNATVEFVKGALHDPVSLQTAAKDVEWVIHSAALKAGLSRSEYFQVNGVGTRRLAEAATTSKKLQRVIYVSSVAAQGPSDQGPRAVEEEPLHPVSDYGWSKGEGERLLKESKVRYTILRPPIIYGPRDEDMFYFFRIVAKGIKPVLGGGPRYLTMLHVHDVVSAILAAMDHPAVTLSRTYNIGDGQGATWTQVGDLAQQFTGRKAVRFKLPVWALFTAAALSEGAAALVRSSSTLNLDKAREARHHWVFSGATLTKDTGWTPRFNLEEGFRDTFEWYKKEGWL